MKLGRGGVEQLGKLLQDHTHIYKEPYWYNAVGHLTWSNGAYRTEFHNVRVQKGLGLHE